MVDHKKIDGKADAAGGVGSCRWLGVAKVDSELIAMTFSKK